MLSTDERNRLFTASCCFFAGTVAITSAASTDYDADGDMDVYIGNWPNSPGPDELNTLYRNNSRSGHWLRLRLLVGS